ncbi:hypothetical protein H8K35_08265 [Undibacterium sp. LX40W]|uniref:Uncharacterized protein n=1 Tax=Undibacterium nitidum TaxID=2762298 RepID=A0A923HS95_9BURK|nr:MULTISPECIES: hypothetical protein [Undibacterium]MBC3881572.1 hypothetical protein [Undibacterium nitidum]MBC3891646.1 hypothetical protein [Undibacterium sp. LX40W]
MQTTTTIISRDHREQLSLQEQIDIGIFRSRKRPDEEHRFIVACDARPLLALFDAAALGSRVYELMTIARPADILSYLHLTMIDVDEGVLNFVRNRIKAKEFFKEVNFENGIAFLDFDQCFTLMEDDNEDFERIWLSHRRSTYWSKKLLTLLSLTKEVQQSIRQIDDFLLQHEIKLIDHGQHHRDLIPKIDRLSLLENKAYRKSTLPEPLFTTIAQLIQQDDIRSVSCPFTDYPLWRLLVEEQIRRAQKSGLPAKEAFFLSGPDGYKMNLTGADTRYYPNEPEDWGGIVHVPYEGATGADLFIKPDWHNFRKDQAGEDGSLSNALFGKPCRYMLSDKDYGELGCASRREVGDWVLYRCNKG